MISLVIILTVSTQLMFAMRRGVVRQQLQVEARQGARAAADYTAMLLRGCTDFNRAGANAGAILTYLTKGSKGASQVCPGGDDCYQVSYNNVTSADYAAAGGIIANLGTDILTFARPADTQVLDVMRWPGWQHAANARFDAKPTCRQNGNNAEAAFQAFKLATGEHDDTSNPLLLIDDNGNWAFYQITNYGSFSGSDCTADNNQCRDPQDDPPVPDGQLICFKVQASPGASDGINPPSGQPTLQNPKLMIGVRYASLRVRTDPATGVPWLEQKDGIFDPDQDNPGTNFIPILPNIEDLQIAWVFNNGTILNDATHPITAADGVPQANTAPVAGDDVRQVAGFRVTVTARAAQPMPIEVARFVRPAAEDHVAGTTRDSVYRYQISANAMIRNRVVGS